jgi:hypothetical protein
MARLIASLAGIIILALAAVVPAAEWGAITPGESVQETVRARYGAPTRMASQKIEGYDSPQWVYEGAQAPRGFTRAVFDFGILTPKGYRAELVRTIRLEPRPGIFTRTTVLNGWGVPTRVGRDKDADVFFYADGLLVYFNKEGWIAETMIFTPPQKPGDGAAPAKP